MLGLHACTVSLVLFLASAGGPGPVHGLGEDPDRPLLGPPGSPIRLEVSDPGLLKALQFAEERYNRGSNAMHLRRISRVVSATRQVGVPSHGFGPGLPPPRTPHGNTLIYYNVMYVFVFVNRGGSITWMLFSSDRKCDRDRFKIITTKINTLFPHEAALPPSSSQK